LQYGDVGARPEQMLGSVDTNTNAELGRAAAQQAALMAETLFQSYNLNMLID
jgi:hypothetical protein